MSPFEYGLDLFMKFIVIPFYVLGICALVVIMAGLLAQLLGVMP